MSERTIIVNTLTELKRAPGGHWYRYVATYADAEVDDGRKGYGQTEREAQHDLRRQGQ